MPIHLLIATSWHFLLTHLQRFKGSSTCRNCTRLMSSAGMVPRFFLLNERGDVGYFPMGLRFRFCRLQICVLT